MHEVVESSPCERRFSHLRVKKNNIEAMVSLPYDCLTSADLSCRDKEHGYEQNRGYS